MNYWLAGPANLNECFRPYAAWLISIHEVRKAATREAFHTRGWTMRAELTTADGRFTALMPHPERVFRNVQMSWSGGDPGALSPWMRMFRNARAWLK